jgi:cytochrome P450
MAAGRRRSACSAVFRNAIGPAHRGPQGLLRPVDRQFPGLDSGLAAANNDRMAIVTELDLPEIDITSDDLTGDGYHQRLAELARLAGPEGAGWLARAGDNPLDPSSALAYLVLGRTAGEFFLRSRLTEFPGPRIADLFGVTTGRLREQIDANILNQQGDTHRRLRALIGPALTPSAANRWRPMMREFLGQLWDELAEPDACEFVTAVAKPYSSLTIAAVLGAPLRDAPRLHEWARWVQRQFDVGVMATQAAETAQAVTEVYGYVEELFQERQARPRDDLLTVIHSAENGDDGLSHDECVNLVVNFIAAGIETTQGQLGHAMRLFAAHPAQWDLLRERPGLTPAATQEVLRTEPVTPVTARICTGPVEYQGVIFPTGTMILVCAERANREQEQSEEFDITAERDERLLTFGAGPHFCAGTNLARAELEEALTFLPPRMPGLAVAGPVELDSVVGIYAIRSLPLRWSGA